MKLIFLTILFFLFSFSLFSQEHLEEKETKNNTMKFSPELVRAFETLPIQNEGRIKPLNTFASVLLLKINGKRTIRDSGVSYSPMQWLLLVLFYPQIANEQKIFLVDNNEVLENFGYRDSKPRDRYSFNQLLPLIDDLFEKADSINRIERDKQTTLDTQIVALASALKEYLIVSHTLDGFRPMPKISQLGVEENLAPRTALTMIETARKQLGSTPQMQNLPEETQKTVLAELERVSQTAQHYLQLSDWLKIFPISGKDEEGKDKEWATLSEIALAPQTIKEPYDFESILQAFETTIKNLKSNESDVNQLITLSTTLHEQIDHHPLMKDHSYKVLLEVSYYHWNLIYNSLILFVLVFLSISLSFVKPNAQAWYKFNFLLLTIPVFLLSFAIVLRIQILGRPPVATLYETILFITAVIGIISLYVERIYGNKLALYAASIIGASGLFLSYRYELSEGTDTMGNLAAVLNSNFWLASHVTTITIGYSAGLLAAFFAHIYIFSKVFRTTTNPKFFSEIKRIIYGVICFCSIFSIIGTILGGIWANYSWGRFWGWDPKENGALAIVLWCLLILHARMGGIIREFGLVVLSLIGGVVVVASWWGVNQLGIGLHSYGFTNGAKQALLIFGYIEGMILLIAIVHHYFIEPHTKQQTQNTQP